MSIFRRAALGLGVGLTIAGAAQAQEIFGGRYEQKTGEAIYHGVCQACHMPNAMGAVGAGAYPALAHDPRLAAPEYPILTVLNGRKAMPNFGDALSNDQIAEVVTYIRTHFGNAYAKPVTPAEVAALRTPAK
jgi:mono/diheme cytochrome c family protein